MKIFLSHKSRDKPLVTDFKELLPPFLQTWLDDDRLSWGASLALTLKSEIQASSDFVVIFLDEEALRSSWVQQELAWTLEQEERLGRTFLLPIVLPGTAPEDLPEGLSERVSLQLADYDRASIEALAKKATDKLFQLIVVGYALLQAETKPQRSLLTIRDELSAGQAQLLGYITEKCQAGGEVTQRSIEHALHHSRASSELYYRLETLIHQGLVTKRRIPADGMFAYRLTTESQAVLSDE